MPQGNPVAFGDAPHLHELIYIHVLQGKDLRGPNPAYSDKTQYSTQQLWGEQP